MLFNDYLCVMSLWMILLILTIKAEMNSESTALLFIMLLTFKYLAFRMMSSDYFSVDTTIMLGFIVLQLWFRSPQLAKSIILYSSTSILICLLAWL